jgi:methyltransferase (TIGR00027 family)
MRLFELDAPTTQRMKVEQFRLRAVEIPSNVTFVPINFETELVEEKLVQSGFKRNQRTLVILEGVLQYLNPEAVNATFTTIQNMVCSGSRIIFDHAYAFVVRGEGNVYGQERMIDGVNRFGESWQFGLDETEVKGFVEKYHMNLVDQKSPRELEVLNFKGADGVVRAKINGTQGIAMAVRK